ncbi:fumarylacetoacetate hydrolase family protein [Nonomuraea aridisoli]|uniref:Ureidoglycolate lyase n=1 Tax=Nonomuraea aridisoli TaxID=2070368 RepID=A0A2W2DZG2_9ACTN|nr:fumarylacetoacetate hydrolase family protein [Nonomuraea aridisoli]PZG15451.1 ureidoglycolate lyase [Nonomuraea aridisoli]
MRLMRIGDPGAERPVVAIDTDSYVDVSDVVTDFDGAFFASGLESLAATVSQRVAVGEVRRFAGERVGAPITRPHQILCVGLNYADHAAESGQEPPEEPIIFTKAPNTLVGPDDDVHIPRGSDATDWEVELGVVVGKRARYLGSDEEARATIAGYVLVNDVSERTFQLHRGGQWVKGKSAETFNPCGPWLVTPDELGDVGDLAMWLDVNGVRRQSGSTKHMLFDPVHVVRYLSQFMVLEPGDLINTGTPAGVGMGLTPPVYLKPGDRMELGIDGLGRQSQAVVAAP